jgi:hypothetical protein
MKASTLMLYIIINLGRKKSVGAERATTETAETDVA